MDEPVEIRVLGRFCVRCDGEEIANEEFGGRLPRRFLRVLATQFDHVVGREVLIEALWPRRPPRDPDGNLNVLVNRARRAVRHPDAIATASGGYRLTAGGCRLDVAEFRRLQGEGRVAVHDGQPAIGLARLQAALLLWAEPYPEDLYEEWAQPIRRALHEEHQVALETAASAALLVHQPELAAGLAGRALEHDPLRERAHLTLVRALTASGERAGALAALGALRRLLDEELGIGISEEAVELERQLLLDRSSSQPAPGAPVEVRHDTPAHFVGRRPELALLCRLAPGGQRVAVVEGDAGSGKSALLREAASRLPYPVLHTKAFLPESTTPWALARTVLREVMSDDITCTQHLPTATSRALADLVVPELADDGQSQVPLEEETSRALAIEGAIRLLDSVAEGGAVLMVDDLQWADATSLSLLELAVARIDELVVVLAHRPLTAHDHVSAFMRDLHRITTVGNVRMGPLQVDEIAALTRESELARVLAEECDGTPFAVHEVLGQLRSKGEISGDAGAARPTASARALHQARRAAREGKRRSVLARAGQQPPAARELLSLMALLGREGSVALLARASDRTHRDVVDDLDHLARVGLARLGDRGWTPAHDIISHSVIDELSRAERGRLHQLLADALEGPSEPGERASHLRGAGDDRAAAAFAHAAREELDRHAHREAERLAGLGLESVPDVPTRADLLTVRADTRAHRGDLAGARDDLRDALRLTPAGPRRSSLLTRSARLAMSAGDVQQASELIDLALLDAGDERRARARALALGSIVDMNEAADWRARARAAEALDLYEQLGDGHGRADILDVRAMASFLDGDIRGGVEAFDRVAQLFEDSGNLLRVVTPRSTRGHGLVFLGQPTRGLAETDRALDLANSLGHLESQAYVLWHRSEAQTALGDPHGALESAARSRSLAEQVGHRGWTATAWRAAGLAHAQCGDHEEALDAFRRSLSAGDAVPLFACWAHARISISSLALGDLEGAADHAQEASALGPPLGHYEARLAAALVASARGDRAAETIVATARRRAVAGGHLVSADILASITGPTPSSSGSSTARSSGTGSAAGGEGADRS